MATDIELKGLLLHVLTHGGARASVVLVGDNVPKIHEASESTPAVILVKRNIGGVYLHLEPVVPVPDGHVGYMDSGKYAHTNDDRYKAAVGVSYPIPLHNRTESRAQYARLSN